MSTLVRAELLKLRTTRLPFVFALAVAGLALLGTVASALTAGRPDARTPPLESPEGVRNVFSAGAGAATTWAMVLGIIVVSGEWRHRTVTQTFLVTPRRRKVVTAKLVAMLAVGTLYAVLAVAVTVVSALVLLSVKGVDDAVTEHGVPRALLGGALATVIYGILGVGVGALIRNQVAAIIGALVWDGVANTLLVQFLPELGRWTPTGAASAMTGVASTTADLLPMWAGALVLTAYAVVLAAVGARMIEHRDVT